jgi:AGCS family alanine or glycine:cation symporter
LVGLVLMGGVKRIADVAGKLVPLMAIFYIGAGVVVLVMNTSEIPAAFSLIIESAFSPVAAQGGFAGAAVWAAIRFGVAYSHDADHSFSPKPISHSHSCRSLLLVTLR